MTKVAEVIQMMGEIAPQSLAEDWDNVGLQVGSTGQEVKNVLLALDFNKEILKEAKNKNCQLIITHHPLIFNGLSSINSHNQSGRLIMELIKNEISLYSAHTNLDIAEFGLNDFLINKLPVKNVSLLKITKDKNYHKLVTFVPRADLEKTKKALFKKGAGKYKNYDNSSFTSEGTGTFKPLENSDPYLGQKNKINQVKESKLEMIVAPEDIAKVVKELKKVHPYEEPAWDLFELKNIKSKNGLGRVADLKSEIDMDQMIKLIKNLFELEFIKYVKTKDKINKIALCSGSGADFIKDAFYKGADLYLTGDVKYHEAQLAEELGINLIDFGHYGSEKYVKELLLQKLSQKLNSKQKNELNFLKSKVNTSPWNYYQH